MMPDEMVRRPRTTAPVGASPRAEGRGLRLLPGSAQSAADDCTEHAIRSSGERVLAVNHVQGRLPIHSVGCHSRSGWQKITKRSQDSPDQRRIRSHDPDWAGRSGHEARTERAFLDRAGRIGRFRTGLNPPSTKVEYGFKSRPGHSYAGVMSFGLSRPGPEIPIPAQILHEVERSVMARGSVRKHDGARCDLVDPRRCGADSLDPHARRLPRRVDGAAARPASADDLAQLQPRRDTRQAGPRSIGSCKPSPHCNSNTSTPNCSPRVAARQAAVAEDGEEHAHRAPQSTRRCGTSRSHRPQPSGCSQAAS